MNKSTDVQNRLAAVLGAAAALWLVLVAQVFFVHDDYMYVTSAALLPQYGLYTEILYLQMPLLIWLQSAVLGALSAGAGGYQALVSLNIFFVLAACYLALATVRSRSPVVWLAVWLAMLGSFAVIMTAGAVSNHALQLLLGACLLRLCLGGSVTTGRAMAAGLLCGLMIACKLNSLPFLLPLLVWLLQGARFFKHAAYAALGGFLALLPVLLLFMQDPAAFWYANVTAPLLNNDLRGASSTVELTIKLLRQFIMPSVLVLMLYTAFVCIMAMFAVVSRRLWLWGSFLLAAAGAALLPGKVFDFHFALLLLVACAAAGDMLGVQLNSLAPLLRQRLILFLWPMILLGALDLGTSGIMKNAPAKSITLEYIADAYRQALAKQAVCAPSVFSTAAIPALAGPLPVHPASASGPFVMRLDPEKVIGEVLAARSAVLTGYHADMQYEQVLVAALDEQHYTALQLGTYKLGERAAAWVLWLPRCYA